MGKRSKKVRDRILVGILSLAMLLTGATIPTGTEKAQAADITLSAKSGSSFSGTNVSLQENPYGSDYFHDVYFDIPSQIKTKDALTSNGIKSIEVKVTVTDFSGSPSAMIYAQPGEDGKWEWNATDGVAITKGQQLTVSYDFSKMNWNGGSTFGNLVLRFANASAGTVSYTINSAKLITDGSSSSGGTSSGSTGSGSGGTATGEQLKGVSASVTYLPANSNDWYSEYSLTVKNDTSSSVGNFLIKIPVSGNANNLTIQVHGNLGGTASYSDGYIIIRFTQTVAAGDTFSSGDGKFGFGEGKNVVLGTPVIVEDDGSYTSSSKLNYEITGQTKDIAAEDTPFGKHGKLTLQEVSGYKAPIIVDKNGKPFQLRGASTHGMHWEDAGGQFVNKQAFQSLRDEWGVNMIRLVSYITQGGYTEGSKDKLDQKIETGVQAATDLGMYVLIDWHVHAENPWTKVSDARTFFEKYAEKYKDYDNVLFEICNEPTGVEWYNNSGADLYSYAKDICTVIRKQDSDVLIICGTNTWSQDVDDVAKKPLKDDGFKNVLYTFHFYSGSHYEDKRAKVRTAISDGTPLFVTEFGICDASGNGGYDTANADDWINLFDENGISYACWSLSNKDESASYLLPGASANGGWVEKDLSTTGIWLINTYRAHQDKEDGTDTSKGDVTSKPSSSPNPSATPDSSGNPEGDDPSPTPSGTAPSQTQTPGGGGSSQGGDSSQGGGGSSQGGGGSSQGGDGSSQGGDSSQGGGGSSQTPGSGDGNNDPGTSQNPQASDLPAIGTVEGVIADADTAVDKKWSGADARLAEQVILSQNSDKDIAGSTFGGLKLMAKKASKNSITLKWSAVKGASKYIVYGNRCGSSMEYLGTVTGTSWTHSDLDKGTYYKYVVTACHTVSGVDVSLSISKTVHATTLGGKKGNAKKVTVKKAKAKLKKGKSFKIKKAKQVPQKKKMKIAKHREICYESSNPAVATVSAKGKIKAKKKGKCNIYVYAQNGVCKPVKVTVK